MTVFGGHLAALINKLLMVKSVAVVELGRVDAGTALMADASLLLPTPNGSFRPQWM